MSKRRSWVCQRFVADGRFRILDAETKRDEQRLLQAHADELERAGFWGRLWWRLRIRARACAIVKAKADDIAPKGALYLRA